MESLYRKYRPLTFQDVVGQQHVVSTLEHAVLEGRTSHAYLFCGPRGTGKTTMARILAKALECEEGPGHLPDGTCEQCRLIAAGEHPDVYELDAASRTGVDNVREEIINRVGYAPVRGTYKVYIIDEVHMLTTAAFNALLKTLEEPPEHVVFILCTTDPQKVPTTILSRVQRFDFHALSNQEIEGRLAYVCEQEGFSYDQEALELVARHARGGMRDALGTLEQLSVFGDGKVTLEAARDLLGEVSDATLGNVASALARRDVAELFNEVAALVDGGRDLLQFTRELAAHLRDVYVVEAVGADPKVLPASAGDVEQLAAEADAFGSVDRVARALEILGDASNEMRTATNQRLVLEVAFTKIARPESDLSLEALAERVHDLELQVQALTAPGVVMREGMAVPSPQRPSAARAAEAPAAAPSAAPRQERTPEVPARPAAAPVSQQPAQRPEAPTPQRSETPAQPAAAPATARPAGRPAPAPQPEAPAAAVTPPAAPQAQPAAARPASSQAAASPAPQAASPAASGDAITDPGQLQRMWKQVVDGLIKQDPARGSLLMSSHAIADDGQSLTIELPRGSSFSLHMLARPDVDGVVRPAVRAVFGGRTPVYVEAAARKQKPAARRARPAAQPRPAAQTQRGAQPQPTAAPTTPPPASAAAPAPQQASPAPAPAEQPMPWDEPTATPAPAAPEPPYEEVPYTDADVAFYASEEDQEVARQQTPVPQQQVPAPQRQVRPQAPEPAAPSPAPATPPAPQSAPAAPKPATFPAAADDATPKGTPISQAEGIPRDLADMLEGVFGKGVNVIIQPSEDEQDTDLDEDEPEEDAGVDEPVDDFDDEDDEE